MHRAPTSRSVARDDGAFVLGAMQKYAEESRPMMRSTCVRSSEGDRRDANPLFRPIQPTDGLIDDPARQGWPVERALNIPFACIFAAQPHLAKLAMRDEWAHVAAISRNFGECPCRYRQREFRDTPRTGPKEHRHDRESLDLGAARPVGWLFTGQRGRATGTRKGAAAENDRARSSH
jgi:hypothetical protein